MSSRHTHSLTHALTQNCTGAETLSKNTVWLSPRSICRGGGRWWEDGREREEREKIRGEAAATHLGDDYCFFAKQSRVFISRGGRRRGYCATAKRESDERGGEAGVGRGGGVNSGRGGETELRSSFAACSHLLSGSGDETGATRNPSPPLTVSLTEFVFCFFLWWLSEAHN